MVLARVRCLLGGYAPCFDDLCHGVDTTMCGLELGFDFCRHDQDPDLCDECHAEEDDFGVYGEDDLELGLTDG